MLTEAPTIEMPSVPADKTARRMGRAALFAAVYTYLLVVFGGLVRITESGLGCGDDWPKCHGQWIPEFTLQTVIEYVHRLLGVSIGLVIIALTIYVVKHRKRPGIGGQNGIALPIYIAMALVVVQGLLGAVTVVLELPTEVVVVHFMTALIIMGLLLQAAVRAGTLGGESAAAPAATAARYRKASVAAALLGFVVITFGALTANTTGAPQACQGFPLCNGALLPASVPQVHLHWTHRLLAFALFLHVLFTVLRRTELRGAAWRAGIIALLLITTQLVVAAALVLLHLPRELMAIHLAAGAAVWGALVAWVLLARRLNRQLDRHPEG
jgi:heme A synthase